jgi:hypothetical protein
MCNKEEKKEKKKEKKKERERLKTLGEGASSP